MKSVDGVAQFVAAAMIAAFCLLTTAPRAEAAEFTIAVIPDTQNYIDYTHQTAEGFPFDASEIFFGQMQFIAKNAASNGAKVVFATAVGDMWQHPTEVMDPAHAARGFKRIHNPHLATYMTPRPETHTIEMPTVKKGFELIAGKVPFSVVPGNHDYDAVWTDPRFPPAAHDKGPKSWGTSHVGGLDNFRAVFSDQSEFFREMPWYVASHDGGADSAQVFSAGGYQFLHIGLQFDPPDASLEWAASVIRRYPGLPTIISTHNYLDPSGVRLAGPGVDNHAIDSIDNTPQMVWDEFLSRHDQIFLVLCGHRAANGLRIEENSFGHKVYQVLSNYQNRQQTAKTAGAVAAIGGIGDGWLRLMRFNLGADTPRMHVRTYSTHYKKFSTELRDYAAWYKAAERPTLSDKAFHAGDDYILELTDFKVRFGKGAGR